MSDFFYQSQTQASKEWSQRIEEELSKTGKGSERKSQHPPFSLSAPLDSVYPNIKANREIELVFRYEHFKDQTFKHHSLKSGLATSIEPEGTIPERIKIFTNTLSSSASSYYRVEEKANTEPLDLDQKILFEYKNSDPTDKSIEWFEDKLNSLSVSHRGEIVLLMPIDLHFIESIATLRAIRILIDQSDLNVSLGVEISRIDSEENRLIAESIQSSAALLGGADYLFFSPVNEVAIWNYHQMTCVLIDEAKLTSLGDPLRGSHTIETITQQLIKNTRRATDVKRIDSKYNIQSFSITNDPELAPRISEHQAGKSPFMRGPHSSMYTGRAWTIRQYAGFSTAEESNKFYKDNLKSGQTGLSVAFDLPTHRGYDSDHERVEGDVGKSGVAIDTVEDFKQLFDGISLDTSSVSMTMNGAVLPILSYYIVSAQEQGANLHALKGTIQNDILKEFMVRNTYIYPPEPSMRIVRDIFSYCSEHLPSFNTISISGYHMHEAGASAVLEIAFTLADGLEYVKAGLQAGLDIDAFAPRLTFFWGIGINPLVEAAKMRAARVLWAQLMSPFDPQNPKSLKLRTHCQTSGWSLTAQQPVNNICRTVIEAMGAVMGGTQSLHTNSYDEALALPTPKSAAIARNTQLVLRDQTDIKEYIDPLGGSFALENLTQQMIEQASELLTEIKSMGGMLQAVKKGWPQRQIQRSAAEKQSKIDTGKIKITGINSNSLGPSEKVDLLSINNREVREKQIRSITSIKTQRDPKAVKKALDQLEKAALGEENLLEASIDATRNRATLGEISNAIENAFGRHKASPSAVSGVYQQESMTDPKFIEARSLSNQFVTRAGRRPRILMAKMGQDGHDRGLKVVASALADMGFDVDLGSLFQTPHEVGVQAIENDVHIVGISSQAGGHSVLVEKLKSYLVKEGADDIEIVVGGIIPEQDYSTLEEMGVLAIFGPGTNIAEAATKILTQLLSKDILI